MTRLSSAFGNTGALRVKSFELGGHLFKVRIPLTKEMEEMNRRIEDVPQDELDLRYQKMTSAFRDGEKIDGIEVTDDDVIVDGRSSRELASSAIKIERRIFELFSLLVPENGNLEGLTYQEIEEEFPFSVQVEMIAKISEAIQPGFKEQRKNS
jgi:hypothetical protein